MRLKDLKTASLYGAIRTVMHGLASDGRCGVLLAGSSDPKSFKRENLQKYEPKEDDKHPACNSQVNLFALPPCSCELAKSPENGAKETHVVLLPLTAWRWKTVLAGLRIDCVKKMCADGGFYCPYCPSENKFTVWHGPSLDALTAAAAAARSNSYNYCNSITTCRHSLTIFIII